MLGYISFTYPKTCTTRSKSSEQGCSKPSSAHSRLGYFGSLQLYLTTPVTPLHWLFQLGCLWGKQSPGLALSTSPQWQGVKGRRGHTLSSFSPLPPLPTVFPNLSHLIVPRGRRSLLMIKQPQGFNAENTWSTKKNRFKQHPSPEVCDSQSWWRTVTTPVSPRTAHIYQCSAKKTQSADLT